MTYVLGTAGATGAPPRLQYTCKGDDFYSLGKAYGVTATAIMQLQPPLAGRVTNALVQGFVKSRVGWSPAAGLRPYDAKSNPGTKGPDGKPEGWAIFTADTQLLLPDQPRLDGKVPRGAPVVSNSAPPGAPPVVIPPPFVDPLRDLPGPVVESGIGPGAIALGLAALVAAIALLGRRGS